MSSVKNNNTKTSSLTVTPTSTVSGGTTINAGTDFLISHSKSTMSGGSVTSMDGQKVQLQNIENSPTNLQTRNHCVANDTQKANGPVPNRLENLQINNLISGANVEQAGNPPSADLTFQDETSSFISLTPDSASQGSSTSSNLYNDPPSLADVADDLSELSDLEVGRLQSMV